ncbi:hypothetical protein EYC80_002455 [Monilinia laxa]|uniref:Uncharacterized protein n=1 Tax=Monilinia laxa TaxID=61186 RepID=A0A5N6K3V0_MONLA|nr:hypothetical protein EYC80_002455 [Monilinia laxa]
MGRFIGTKVDLHLSSQGGIRGSSDGCLIPVDVVGLLPLPCRAKYRNATTATTNPHERRYHHIYAVSRLPSFNSFCNDSQQSNKAKTNH